MRQKEERYKPKENTMKEVFKSIGLGIAFFLILIGCAYFLTSVPMVADVCSCSINGMDLNYCQNVIQNISSGLGVI